jgi:hypothetical protein
LKRESTADSKVFQFRQYLILVLSKLDNERKWFIFSLSLFFDNVHSFLETLSLTKTIDVRQQQQQQQTLDEKGVNHNKEKSLSSSEIESNELSDVVIINLLNSSDKDKLINTKGEYCLNIASLLSLISFNIINSSQLQQKRNDTQRTKLQKN